MCFSRASWQGARFWDCWFLEQNSKNLHSLTSSWSSEKPYILHKNLSLLLKVVASKAKDLPSIYMAWRHSLSFIHSLRGPFFPFPANELVVSQPVNECSPGSALHFSTPAFCTIAGMSKKMVRVFNFLWTTKSEGIWSGNGRPAWWHHCQVTWWLWCLRHGQLHALRGEGFWYLLPRGCISTPLLAQT